MAYKQFNATITIPKTFLQQLKRSMTQWFIDDRIA